MTAHPRVARRARRADLIVSLMPIDSEFNQFVALFTRSIAAQGLVVRNFVWGLTAAVTTDVVILHWPNEFFMRISPARAGKVLLKLIIMNLARRLHGTRFVWVAHNVAPHDQRQGAALIASLFLRSLDGVIYLSEHSRELVAQRYPECRSTPSLTTVHGHYKDVAITPARPYAMPVDRINLAYVGLVRPYKNLELLVESAAKIDAGLHLTLSGVATDPTTAATLAKRIHDIPHIDIELRDDAFSAAEFEARVDAADAIVLPYRKILNSGAALFALSRNRPVLAPRMGSLPELRDAVGAEWMYLYDGEFDSAVLRNFLQWLKITPRAAQVPTEAFDWSGIGRSVGEFLRRV